MSTKKQYQQDIDTINKISLTPKSSDIDRKKSIYDPFLKTPEFGGLEQAEKEYIWSLLIRQNKKGLKGIISINRGSRVKVWRTTNLN